MEVQDQIRQLEQVLGNEWLDTGLRQEVEAQLARLKTEFNPVEEEEVIEPFFENFIQWEYRKLCEYDKSRINFERFKAKEGRRIQSEYRNKMLGEPEVPGFTPCFSIHLLNDLAGWWVWTGPSPEQWLEANGKSR